MENASPNFIIKAFHELSVDELYSILKLRAAVFVVEQTCAYLDLDDKDQQAFHVMMYEGNELAAYARCLPPGVSYEGAAAIGRVVIDPKFRSRKWGYLLMQHCVDFCKKQFNTNKISLSAQYHLQHFYEKAGFTAIGDVYPEDDIPHIKMKME